MDDEFYVIVEVGEVERKKCNQSVVLYGLCLTVKAFIKLQTNCRSLITITFENFITLLTKSVRISTHSNRFTKAWEREKVDKAEMCRKFSYTSANMNNNRTKQHHQATPSSSTVRAGKQQEQQQSVR
uniref:Uncharacterized protein n=1 Tax=Glossina austeni TaxID=7395 RepID=A0A1A9VGQ6_GLOAU